MSVILPNVPGGSIGGQNLQTWFENSAGHLYAVVFDAWALSGFVGPFPSQVPMFFISKSVDKGATWTDVTGLMPSPAGDGLPGGNEPGGQGHFGATVALDYFEDVIYVMAPTGPSGSGGPSAVPFVVYRFDTLTDSWLANLPDGPFPDDTANYGFGWTISVLSATVIDIAYSGPPEHFASLPPFGNPGDVNRIYWSRFSSGSWSVPVELPNQTGIQSEFVPGCMFRDSTGRCYLGVNEITLNPSSPNNVWAITITPGGSLNSMQQIATDATINMTESAMLNIGRGCAYFDHSSIERAVIPYVGGGTDSSGPNGGPAMVNKILRANVGDNPSWFAQVVDTTTQIAADTETTECILYTFGKGGDLYYFWCSPVSYYDGSIPPDPPLNTGSISGGEVLSGTIFFSVDAGSGWAPKKAFKTYGPLISPAGVTPGMIGTNLVALAFEVIVDQIFGVFFGSVAQFEGYSPLQHTWLNPVSTTALLTLTFKGMKVKEYPRHLLPPGWR